MKRLTVSVDDVATLRNLLYDDDFDPVRFALLCEVAGAQGISVTVTGSELGVKEADVHRLRQLHKTFLNLHIPPENPFIKLALSLNPEMVTFVQLTHGDRLRLAPLPSSAVLDTVQEVLPDFRANNISVAVFCYPELEILKQLSRLRIDYVELDCTGYTLAEDSNEELVALDSLINASLAAAKLGFGINCFGGINYEHLPGLAGIPHLEDICMGVNIVKRALLVGVDRAVQEAQQQILFHHRE
ncbi:MAG: hypothetical protein D6681_18810 [Calditrichaeota bacterium]|nr:MAG: hypothetical protein D6681_18810 [Calditrichota bacterium]